MITTRTRGSIFGPKTTTLWCCIVVLLWQVIKKRSNVTNFLPRSLVVMAFFFFASILLEFVNYGASQVRVVVETSFRFVNAAKHAVHALLLYQ